MPEVEILKMVDVVPETEIVDSPTSSERNPQIQRKRQGATLALWPSPVTGGGLVLREHPEHTISVEHVALPNHLDDRLVMLREPESARARSFRLLRHRLFSLADPRVIAVTSARPGEGKTTCALNLALALAEDTMTRVLLLEANLGRPTLGGLLGFTPMRSLVENIAKYVDVTPPYPVAAIAGTRLHVAALRDTPLPRARLDRTLVSIALFDLRNAYDYIVIDAASVFESGDADVIGECASGVLMTARVGHSRAAEQRRAAEQLAPAAVFGTVLLDS
jgi:Mrp family chromosome partitioning ATPase